MRIQLSFALLFATIFAAAPAQAQRVFVSATGSDGNPCSFASPCRTFQHAHDVAPSGGEIDVLDPAGYGAVTITKALSIQGHGFSGITVASGANGITINAPSTAAVTLNGLLIDGAGAGYNGIVFNSGASLTVTGCVVQNLYWNGSGSFFSGLPGNGILIQPTTGAVKFVITNTIVSNNGSVGILYLPLSGSTATATGVIDHVVATNNRYGILISTQNGGGATTAAISNSIASDNSIVGIVVNNIAALAVSMDNVGVSGNITGISGFNTTTVTLGRSVITANTTGIFNSTSANTFFSYRDNRIDGNSSMNITSPLNYSVALQ